MSDSIPTLLLFHADIRSGKLGGYLWEIGKEGNVTERMYIEAKDGVRLSLVHKWLHSVSITINELWKAHPRYHQIGVVVEEDERPGRHAGK